MGVDPDLAAVLGAAAFAAVLSVGGLWRRRHELERACIACGRRVVAGMRTCDCDI